MMLRKPLKIAQLSDLHFSDEKLEESKRCFNFAVEKCIETKVDCVVIAGDLTDHRLYTHSPAFLALSEGIKKLSNHCPVFILQGTFTHDPVGMLKLFELISGKFPVIVSEKIEMIGLFKNRWELFDSKHMAEYDLVISSLPTLNKADLINLVGSENASFAVGEYVAAALASFGPTNQALFDHGVPTMLVSHGTVDGSHNENGVPMSGLDHEFTLGSLYSAKTDMVALGHIHFHQSWERQFGGRKQIVNYTGSIGRFHYGEIGDKSFTIWNANEIGNPSFELLVTPSKKMIDITFDGAPNYEELKSVAEQCKDAYVRVRYNVDEEFVKTINRQDIRDALAGASEIKIESKVFLVQRQRCPGMSVGKSLVDKFVLWCEHTSTNYDNLVPLLGDLQNYSPSEIVLSIKEKLKQTKEVSAVLDDIII